MHGHPSLVEAFGIGVLSVLSGIRSIILVTACDHRPRQQWKPYPAREIHVLGNRSPELSLKAT